MLTEKRGNMKYRLCERARWVREWLEQFASEFYGSAWRGERAPETPVTKSVRVNRRTSKHMFRWLYRTTY